MNDHMRDHGSWEYYQIAATYMGTAFEGDRTNASLNELASKQSGYSLAWFYNDEGARRNAVSRKLSHAFLEVQPVDNMSEPIALPETWFNAQLNAGQKEAIRHAIRDPLTVIYGPPGTGKTSVILELMRQIERLGCTVAVVSQNNAAVDNNHERVQRISKADGEAAEFAKKVVRLGNSATRQNLRLPEFHFAGGSNGKESSILAGQFLACYPVITSTIHSLPKCFKDGLSYRYDYVIVDEASQISPLVGLVASYCAKHLVLLGDHHQLPPVFNDETSKQLQRLFKREFGTLTLPASRTLSSEISILDIGSDIVRASAGLEVWPLTEHFRCHPGIIGFSAQYVYTDDAKLNVRTDTSKFFTNGIDMPIRVRWFRGNYGESFRMGSNILDEEARTSRRNLRQVEVFMQDEWPGLVKKMAANPQLSACILTPYRGQLEELRRRIENSDIRWHGEIKDSLIGDSEENLNDGGLQQFPALKLEPASIVSTIHKSQGREFDIVYLLPVDDGLWEWPWSQKKRLVNVAVSRAKQELIVIVSTELMSHDLQEKLLGKSVHLQPASSQTNDQDQLFVQLLVDFVAQRSDTTQTDGYGLVESTRHSVFDYAPELDQLGLKNETSANIKESSYKNAGEYGTERAVARALAQSKILGNLEAWVVLGEVSWRAFSVNASNRYFDLVIVDRKNDAVRLVIEIDGIHHRYQKKTEDLRRVKEKEKEAEEFCSQFGGRLLTSLDREAVDKHFETNPKFTLLRIPTNGMTVEEFDDLRSDRVPDDAREDSATIEDVIQRQLASGVEGAPTLKIGLPITSYLKSCGIHDLSPKDANIALKKQGLIEKHEGLQYYRPTCEGKEQGILARLRWSQEKDAHYWQPLIDPDDLRFISYLAR